jgi:shikimate dehydrogenase
MQIDGSTRVFLILGDPVEQVRAPAVFNHLFHRHAVNAVLVPAAVAGADLDGFVRHVLRARNIDGLWVTIPHKTAIARMLDHADRLAAVAESVNALRRRTDGSLEGALFDGIGFVKSLDHFGIAARGARALVIGAGGAGVAIGASLAERGVAELALFDPDLNRSARAAQRIGAAFDVPVRPAASAAPEGFDLVVNASPLGLAPDDPLPVDVARLARGTSVVDILMKQHETPLLRACRERGITAHPGFEMLVQQMPEYLSLFGFDTIAQAVRDDASEVRALMQTA